MRHIAAGHVHRPASGNWRGITFNTVRGTNHQPALRFAPGFEVSQETRNMLFSGYQYRAIRCISRTFPAFDVGIDK
ncbi:MAG: hypothetical protein ACSLEN_01965 [Candidatus Malihini olakiniferum]